MSYLVNSSFGPEDLERATVPFILACAAANKGDARVFLTCTRQREVRQSSVLLQEVLDGLGADDRRLHDELVALWRTEAS